jgi:hypothetical protein
MSNPARRRGRGGQAQPQSETSSSRGGVAPAALDGPASRGGTSNPSSGGRRPSNPLSPGSAAGSAPGSPATSPRAAQPGSFSPASNAPSSAGAAPLTDPARDPARQVRLTDSVRNVDLPASLYNLDNLVRCRMEVLALSSQISPLLSSPICIEHYLPRYLTSMLFSLPCLSVLSLSLSIIASHRASIVPAVVTHGWHGFSYF